MAACGHCNTTSPEGAKFCLECGRPLPAAVEGGRVCTSCGQTLTRPVNFCTFCGARQGGTQDEIESPVNSLSARLEIKTPPSERGYETRVDTGKLGEDPGRVTKRIEPSSDTDAPTLEAPTAQTEPPPLLQIPDTDPLPATPPSVPPTQRVTLPDPEHPGGRKNAALLVVLILLIFVAVAGAAGFLFYKRIRSAERPPESTSSQPAPQSTSADSQAVPSPIPPSPTSPPSPAPTTTATQQPATVEPHGAAAGGGESRTGIPAQPSAAASPPRDERRAGEQKAADEARREEQRRAEEEQHRLQSLRDAEERRQRDLAATPRTGNFHWKGLVDGADEIIVRRDNISIRHIEAQPVSHISYSLSSPLPPFMTKVELQGKRGRGKARIVQAPAPSNDYTLIVRVEDPKGGAESLEFTVRWEVVER